MSSRFLQDIDAVRAVGDPRPPTSLYTLIRRLGVSDVPWDLQQKHVQQWIDAGNHVGPQLALSLEAAGFHLPAHA